eukprot:gene25240-biopygen4489
MGPCMLSTRSLHSTTVLRPHLPPAPAVAPPPTPHPGIPPGLLHTAQHSAQVQTCTFWSTPLRCARIKGVAPRLGAMREATRRAMAAAAPSAPAARGSCGVQIAPASEPSLLSPGGTGHWRGRGAGMARAWRGL